MSDPIQVLIDDLKAHCNVHVNGVCQTRACLVRGGWKVGSTEFHQPTCLPREQVVALSDLQSRLTAVEKERDELNLLVKGLEGNLKACEDELESAEKERDSLQLQEAASKVVINCALDDFQKLTGHTNGCLSSEIKWAAERITTLENALREAKEALLLARIKFDTGKNEKSETVEKALQSLSALNIK